MKTFQLLKNMNMCVHNEGDKNNGNNDVTITIMMKRAIDQCRE